MDETKPTFASKTVITNAVLALINLLVMLGVISSDLGLNDAIAAGGLLGVVNVVGNLLAAYFRKKATAKLV